MAEPQRKEDPPVELPPELAKKEFPGGSLGAEQAAAAEKGPGKAGEMRLDLLKEIVTVRKDLEQQATEVVASFKKETKEGWFSALGRVLKWRNKGEAPPETGQEPPAVQAVESKAVAAFNEFVEKADGIVIEPAGPGDAAEAIELPRKGAGAEISDGIPQHVEPEMPPRELPPEISDGVPVHIGPETESTQLATPKPGEGASSAKKPRQEAPAQPFNSYAFESAIDDLVAKAELEKLQGMADQVGKFITAGEALSDVDLLAWGEKKGARGIAEARALQSRVLAEERSKLAILKAGLDKLGWIAPKPAADEGIDIDVSDFDTPKAEAEKRPAAETAEEALARKEKAYKKMVDREAELEEQVALADDVASGRLKKEDLTPKQRKLIDATELEEAQDELKLIQEVIGKVADQIEADPLQQKKARAEAPDEKKREKPEPGTANGRPDKEPKLGRAIDAALKKYDRALDNDRAYLAKLKAKGNPDDLEKAAGFLMMAQKQLEGWSAEEVLDNMVLTDEMTFADAEKIKEAGLAEDVKAQALEIRRKMLDEAIGAAMPEPDFGEPLELEFDPRKKKEQPAEEPTEVEKESEEAEGEPAETPKAEEETRPEEAAATAVVEAAVDATVEAAAEAIEGTPQQAVAEGFARFRKGFMEGNTAEIVRGGYDEKKARMLPRLVKEDLRDQDAVRGISAMSPEVFLKRQRDRQVLTDQEYKMIRKDPAQVEAFHRRAVELAQERLKMVQSFLKSVPDADMDRAGRADEMAKGQRDHKAAFWKAWDDLKAKEGKASRKTEEAPAKTKAKMPPPDEAESPEEKAAEAVEEPPATSDETSAPEAPEAAAGKSLFDKKAMKGIVEVMEGSGLAATYKTLKLDKFTEALKNAGYDMPGEGALAEDQMKKLLTKYREAQAAQIASAAKKKR